MLPAVCLFIEYFGMSNVVFNKRHYLTAQIPVYILTNVIHLIISKVDYPLYKFASYEGIRGYIVPLSIFVTYTAFYMLLGLLNWRILKAQGHERIFNAINGEPLEDTNET